MPASRDLQAALAGAPPEPTPVQPRDGLERHIVRSADGTQLAAFWSPPAAAGASPMVVVLAADLAETVPEVWQPQLEYLRGHRRAPRFVAWDYRGTGSSDAPTHGRFDAAAHLEDLWAVLVAAGVPADVPVVFLATGVGVRIALEAALALPERVRGLVLIGGAAGWRYHALCGASWVAAVVAERERQRSERAALVSAVTRGVDRAMHLAEMSLLDPGTEPLGALRAVASSLRSLGTGPVVEHARRIQQPALVICGETDPRMPPALAHQLARHLTRSRVLIVPRASSRLAARLPDLVNLEVERFLDQLHADRDDDDRSGGDAT